MGRGEGDADGEDVRIAGHLVGTRPVLGPPFLERFARVVRVDLHEPIGGEELVGDVRPVGVVGVEINAAERRQQHGEVEEQRVRRTIHLLVVDDALLDARDVGPGDRADPTLSEERLGPQLGRRLESPLGEGQPADAEVPELVLVGQVDDVGQVTDTGLAHLVLHVERVLEGRSLAGTGPVPHPDDEDLAFTILHPLDRSLEGRRRVDCMARGAHRVGVAVGSESGSGTEVELRAGRVDQVVVVQLAVFAGTGRVGIGDLDVGPWPPWPALRVDRRRQRLMELDPLALVDRSELEGHLVGLHLAHPDPDVRRNPVPVGVRSDHHDLVGAREHPGEMECGRMAGDASAQDDDSCHVRPPSVSLTPGYQIPLGVSSSTTICPVGPRLMPVRAGPSSAPGTPSDARRP